VRSRSPHRPYKGIPSFEPTLSGSAACDSPCPPLTFFPV
jgi:hypothetical protein